MPITLSPSSTYRTPHYKKSLPTTNGVLTPDGTPVDTFAYIIGGSKDNTNVTVKDQVYESNNSTGGISFIAFNRAQKIENVVVNVAANPSGNTDFGDSVFFDTEKSKPVFVSKSTFITGTSSSPTTPANTKDSNFGDKDLLVFGSDKFDNKNTTLGINGLLLSPSTEIDVTDSTVSMGNDADTLIFGSQNINSIIQNSTFELGNGADYIYFNRTQSILGGNKISLSDTSGGDNNNDSIVFASNQLTGVNGSTTKLTIANFENSKDSLRIIGGQTYTTQAAITAAFGSKISFI